VSLAEPLPPSLSPDAHAPALATLRDVGKTFGNRVVALAGLNMEVREGEFVSLLGPSGCGKSTVLRLLAGLSSPTTGAIDWRDGRPQLGFVFQEPTLMPWATVFSNVWLPLRLRGVSRGEAQQQIDEALDRVGLNGFAKAYPRELSGGMKMRVSIARALVTEPQLLLLDEPFAALDEITRFKLNEDLLALWQRHHWTVIFVTHSVFESVFLSNRIVADLPVDLPYPRAAALRTDAGYTAQCARLSQILAQAAA